MDGLEVLMRIVVGDFKETRLPQDNFPSPNLKIK